MFIGEGGIRAPAGTVKYSAQEYADAGMIDKFKMKVREWLSQLNTLKAMKVPASMESEKKRLINLAESVKTAIKAVTSLSDSLSIPGLSAVPLIAAAAVASALAAIAWWGSQYTTFKQKVAYQQSLVSQGMTPAEAAAAANEAGGGGLFDSLKWPLILGVGGFIAYKLFTRNRS